MVKKINYMHVALEWMKTNSLFLWTSFNVNQWESTIWRRKKERNRVPLCKYPIIDFKAYRLFLPLCWPVIKHELSDVARTLAGTEQVLPGLTAHEYQA